MSKKICVLGSINTDLVTRMKRAPGPGETIHGNDFRIIPGGKGANQAVAAARLGGDVNLIACVGDDDFGKQHQSGLASDGIQLDHLNVSSDAPTGVATILVEESGENRIVLAPGANNAITKEMVEKARAVIRSADILMMQLEVPLEIVDLAARIAKEENTAVMLNPAPALPLSDELLAGVNYLVPNESEATLLTGIKVTDQQSAEQAAEQLLTKGVDVVFLTLGAAGVLVVEKGKTTIVPGLSVDAVDTTAAGDTFAGALAVGLNEGKSPVDAAAQAQYAAALSVTRIGAQTSIPTRNEADAFQSRTEEKS